MAGFDRRMSYAFLCISPFLVAIGTARALRIPGVYHAVAGVLVTAISVAAWTLGARAIRADAEERQRLALAGGLLVAPWAVLSLVFPGIGPPWQATEAENQLRYLVLLIAGVLITGGFVALKETLREAGERFYSALGFAAIMLAGPLFLIFTLFMLTVRHAAVEQRASSGQMPNWMPPLWSLAESMLVVEVVLTYVATAAFAAALGGTGWLGRTASRVFVGISFFAILCLMITEAVAIQVPQDPAALFKHWYAIPGFVVGIPAIPFIMPCLFGVVLLRRAGDT